MKTLFVIILILSTFVVSAQTKVINLDSLKKTPKTEAQLLQNTTKTNMVATYKGVNYPVYQSVTSKKPFIIIKAKSSGNPYRKYFDYNALRD